MRKKGWEKEKRELSSSAWLSILAYVLWKIFHQPQVSAEQLKRAFAAETYHVSSLSASCFTAS